MARPSALAPAKVNLFLHVVGRRPNGYHELESLVAFTDFGDEVSVEPAGDLTLSVHGAMAGIIADVAMDDNLVMRAARLLRESAGAPELGAHIKLEKRIPAGAGLGGGSSDAAATLKLLSELWQLGLGEDALAAIGLELGADIPVCLRARTSFVSGIGERLEDARLPRDVWMVLAFTGQSMPTAPVFRDLKAEEWSRADTTLAGPLFETRDLRSRLARTRNDLEAPATRLQAQIARLIDDIAHQPGCVLARMSGSGAACFGIFASEIEAFGGAEGLQQRGWWAVATRARADRP